MKTTRLEYRFFCYLFENLRNNTYATITIRKPNIHNIAFSLPQIPETQTEISFLSKQPSHRNKMDLSDMRKEYTSCTTNFDVTSMVSLDPHVQFKHWFEEACHAHGDDANAMSLATANATGVPSVRMVLLKSFDNEGFRFFSNYGSRKGRELEVNPFCSLMFYWHSLHRSVRIEGKTEKIPRDDSKTYFQLRPRDSQIAASCDYQSVVLPDRKFLDERFDEIEERHAGDDVLPCPDFWGGYLVRPSVIEFWHGCLSRRHDRIRFRLPDPGETIDPTRTHTGLNGWVYERLGP